ncbi:MAG: tRNA (adenosine(37)-N6)-dimethylallyltransferase MiaA [Candidatus Margulisiibacteriota bacterium]
MKPIIILGSTAVGKTKLAIELAKKIDGEIISADSMQVYRGMDIGTAKPTIEERQGIPHHLIDVRNPDEEWTVSDFVKETKKLEREIVARGKTPIIVGGTGLYLRALLEGFVFPKKPEDKDLRGKLELETTPILYSRLSTVDSLASTKIHPNDKKRIVRALEVFELTGKKISELQENRQWTVDSRKLDHSIIGLNLASEALYPRINARVDTMIEKGLIDEVKGLLAKGYSKELRSFQALGYKEAVEYLEGRWKKDKMIEELKKRTRNFARRQMTWFRRFKDVKWFEGVDNKAIIELYLSHAKN